MRALDGAKAYKRGDWGTPLRATVGYDLTQRVELKAESLISKCAFRRATVRRGLVILGFDSVAAFHASNLVLDG